MPGAADKVIINRSDNEADAFAIQRAFEIAEMLTREAKDANVLKEFQQFVSQQEVICGRLAKARSQAIKDQRALNDQMRKHLDVLLGLTAE